MPNRLRSGGGSRPIPPSRRIADELRRAIVSGDLAAGALLPSERELARSHGTARNTARQAIAILQAEGLVIAEHGRGVYVRRQQPLIRVPHDRYARRHREAGRAPFRAEAEAQGRKPRVEVRLIETAPAPWWVGQQLSLGEGESVLVRRNRYLADDQPVQLVDTYLPVSIAGGTPLEQDVPAAGGIYAALEELGHRLKRIEEQITARMPLPEEVEALALAPGVPVLELRHTSYDEQSTPIEVTHSILAADRNMLALELPVD